MRLKKMLRKHRIPLHKNKANEFFIEKNVKGDLVVNFDGNILFYDEKAAKIMGFKNYNEGIGKNVLDLISHEYTDEFHNQLSEIISLKDAITDYKTIEYKIKSLNNKEGWIKAMGSKATFNRKSAVIIAVKDITKQKLEEKLIESEEKYRLITESTSEMISIIDHTGKYIYVNGANKQLGYSPDELIESNGFRFIHPDDLKRLLPELKKYFNKSNEELRKLKEEWLTEKIDYRFKNKNGEYHHLESITSLIEKPGNEEGFNILVLSRDKTEQVKLEESKKDLMYRISHDLKSPIIPIKGWLDIICTSDNYLETIKKFGIKIFEDMKHSADRAIQIVDDNLNVKLIEQGKFKFNKKEENITDIINDSCKEMLYQASEKEIQIKITHENKTNNIFLDKIKMERVLSNLLSNAIKYSPMNSSITIKTIEDKDYIKIQVTDKGVGFTKEELEDVRNPENPYARQKRKKYIKGMGLGLFITNTIIKAHKGKIEFHSEGENRGATVTVMLPKRVDNQ